jgi:hypothetical protein
MLPYLQKHAGEHAHRIQIWVNTRQTKLLILTALKNKYSIQINTGPDASRVGQMELCSYIKTMTSEYQRMWCNGYHKFIEITVQ